MSGEILDAAELAERWGVNKGWVYQKVREGQIPAIPLPGKYVRFRLDVIEEFEKSNDNRRSAA
jgi:excisionase family DNA binding protein